MAYVIVFVLLVAVVIVIVSPLRRGKGGASIGKDGAGASVELPSPAEQERIDLEAAREAKLREIRDAELDHQTGKLSDQDYQAIDSQLRGEAIEILSRIDELDGLAPPQPEDGIAGDDGAGESSIADERSAE